ncbi:serine hydrolase domain-containing protein [Kitasatospora paracochleata]|uniref:D-alanyl-D-alanine carboxypeptidase n=1 Tax=Kitasatospora paracochleata TaxID=58354 RepID=A0ABT1J464_9ACTN|nr:serine hydrolase domain-containing protein [Kitasatospora paracochleata]MCP2312216.1 D-alanyl-D-alanine carboxypeptidase [Kitasatospora paracochleata]
MRRTSSLRLGAALLAVSALVPLTISPAAAAVTGPARSATAPAGAASHRPDDDCPPGGFSPEVTAKLDAAIDQVRQETGTPGVIVGLWMPGQGTYVRATGVADKATDQPMSTDLFMRIGSVTKTFTATTVLELVDRGLVGLDDPIADYVDGVPDGQHITIRQLLEMRSGLFSYSADEEFVHTLESDPTRYFSPQELLAYGYKHDNIFPPGAQFNYSNSNYILLGLVAEKLGRAPIADLVRERVTEPSHMYRTLFPVGAEFPDPHAHGYTNQTLDGQTVDATGWNTSWGWSAGAMISNLRDMHRWAKVMATGTLLSPATQAERLKFLPTGFPGTGYGLGIFETHGWIGHNGSIPGYEAVSVYLPEQKATLVVLINTDILHDGNEPSTLFAQAITRIVTPDHVYDLPAQG